MKYFFVLFIAIATLASCSNDENGMLAEDPIVGEWKLESIEFGETSVELQECEDLETYFFNLDFSFRAERFEFNLIVEECVLNALVEGAWGKNEEGTYFTNTSGNQVDFSASFQEEESLLRIISTDPLSGLQEARTYRKQ